MCQFEIQIHLHCSHASMIPRACHDAMAQARAEGRRTVKAKYMKDCENYDLPEAHSYLTCCDHCRGEMHEILTTAAGNQTQYAHLTLRACGVHMTPDNYIKTCERFELQSEKETDSVLRSTAAAGPDEEHQMSTGIHDPSPSPVRQNLATIGGHEVKQDKDANLIRLSSVPSAVRIVGKIGAKLGFDKDRHDYFDIGADAKIGYRTTGPDIGAHLPLGHFMNPGNPSADQPLSRYMKAGGIHGFNEQEYGIIRKEPSDDDKDMPTPNIGERKPTKAGVTHEGPSRARQDLNNFEEAYIRFACGHGLNFLMPKCTFKASHAHAGTTLSEQMLYCGCYAGAVSKLPVSEMIFYDVPVDRSSRLKPVWEVTGTCWKWCNGKDLFEPGKDGKFRLWGNIVDTERCYSAEDQTISDPADPALPGCGFESEEEKVNHFLQHCQDFEAFEMWRTMAHSGDAEATGMRMREASRYASH